MVGRLFNLFRVPDIRHRLWVTFLFLVLYRVGMNVPLPGTNMPFLGKLLAAGEEGTDFLVMVNMLSGGGIAGCALFSLGIMPYISASIIFSLLVKVVPSLEAVAKEGSAGQRRINQWTRFATVPLAIIQAWIVVHNVYQAESVMEGYGAQRLLAPGFGAAMAGMLALTAGTIVLMWIGEQITEHGIGNGISLLIMAGIIARLPQSVMSMVKHHPSPLTPLVLVALFIGVVVVVVYITKGTRKIPVQYAKLVRGKRVFGGQRHFLPVKVNQAGVMPVIFSSSLLAFPQMISSGLGWKWLDGIFGYGSWFYTVLDVALIYFFSYFWTSLMFNPAEMSKNMKESGSFIPGIRPGRHTADFLQKVMTHMTLAGATFLAVITLVPSWLARRAGADAAPQIAQFLGGTSILIVVSVALDLVDKLNSHLLMRRYEGFMGGEADKS
ncbi:MAG: preprotein translocase subunit SecY [Planctomycetia bacterium]|nr:preprotein translocase subunit SecY [Planctomycetia bacterium]